MAVDEGAPSRAAACWSVDRDDEYRWRQKERDALYRAACTRGPLAALWRRRAETFRDRKLRAAGLHLKRAQI
jgi:hypothetical protein